MKLDDGRSAALPVRRGALSGRLGRYLALTEAERALIERVEAREVRLAAGEVIVRQGEENHDLFVVESGWMHGSRMLPGGARQIVRFHFPGDLAGTSSIAWAQASTTLTAVTDARLAVMPKAELGGIFARAPRLAGLFYAVKSAEDVAMAERLTALGRMDAPARLAALLLDIRARLKASLPGIVESFELPLTQADLGDALGLTQAHVNRTLKVLEADGLIQRTGKRVRIADEPRMMTLSNFNDRYHEIDTSWLPPPMS